MSEEQNATENVASNSTRKPIEYFSAGRRLAMQKSDWLETFYVSYSPRNNNSNAEGPWEEWVDLAEQILEEDKARKSERAAEVAP